MNENFIAKGISTKETFISSNEIRQWFFSYVS